FQTLAEEIQVSSVTLDRFCVERGIRPDVVKIDVEGAELLILKGTRELLQKERFLIFCEVHPPQMENCGSSLPALQVYLESLGYIMEPLDEPNSLGIYHVLITRAA